jgi:Tol biopolymer transport system component
MIASLLVATTCALAEERIADIRQGTNLAVALAPAREMLVVDLLGQLWTLPMTGGAATQLTTDGGQARNPRFSPDGGRIVYQRLDNDQWDLWLFDLATGTAAAITNSPYDEREPDFSADGRTIVYASNRSGQYSIWSLSLDGGAETQLTRDAGTASFPTVSERGLIAYVLAQGENWSLRVRAADGSVAAVHTTGQRLSPPSWRPGGGVLVFGEQETAQTSRLYMLLLAEPRVVKPLSGAEDVFASRAAWLSAAELVYAADGQLWRRGIATPARQPIHLFAGSAVEVAAAPAARPPLDAPGDRPAAAINGVTRAPDGRRIVFTALGDVWLVERGAPERLTDDAFVDVDPTFWPDGESVVFASERTGQFELWRLELRDRKLTQLTFGALQPRLPAVRPDGRQLAYVASESLEPWADGTLELLDWPSGRATRIAGRVQRAESLAWTADGRALSLGAQTALATGSEPRVDLVASTAAPAAQLEAEGLPSVAWRHAAPPGDYVVEVGRLFDGVRATYRRHVDLHVRGGKIAAIVPRGGLPAPGPVIDARDATVIPGLVDVHAHSTALVGERLGRAWLAYGVTTVRELAANQGEARERAEAWASGRSKGPRLIVIPRPMDESVPTSPHDDIAGGWSHSLLRQAELLGIPRLDPAHYPARLRHDWPLRAHELELSPGFSAYQDSISRLTASGTTFVTGLGALGGLDAATRMTRDPAYQAIFTPIEQAAWQRSDDFDLPLQALRATVARLVRAGGRVAVGSHAPAVPYGLGLHLELAELARAGIAGDQVLRMATAEGALALGLEQQLGTLEEGKLADFVVLDGDPLATMGDALNIVAVAKGGAWYDRAALLAP